tara:strand:+ start:69 stop:1040 length:972 start_codon:yes stop_codon:yes gene_type:complete
MSKKIKVSFLICVFNGENFLDQALLSIKNQTYQNFEVVIVNDASTDDSLLIINKYSKDFTNYRIINNSNNIGLTRSLNLAAKFAKGEWLARLDADDVCHHSRIDKQLKLCSSKNSIALIGSGCNFIDSDNRFIFKKNFGQKSAYIRNQLQKVNAFFPHSSALIKKSIFLKMGGYDEFFKYAQDYDLWLRISEKYQIVASRDHLVNIRIHKNRISSKTQDEQFIFARSAIVSYWLRREYNIKTNQKIKKKIYKNLISYISKNSYYQGYFYFQNIKKLLFQKSYIKCLYLSIKKFHFLLLFIIIAISLREYFLKIDSIKILKNNY